MKESIQALRALEKQYYAYYYALAAIEYDESTVAPPESAAGRAVAAEALSEAQFRLLVNPETDALLTTAAADAETEQEKAEVRELRRRYNEICRIPPAEYAAFASLAQQSVTVWGKAKRNNDFAAYAPYLEKLVAGRRAQAGYIAPGRDPYEVWLDQYERGLTIARCDEFFATLRTAIVPLLAAIRQRGRAVRADFLDADWPMEGQRAISQAIMRRWTIDPEHCILGETEHPFTTNFWRGDVRITTHYLPRDMASNLYSVAHEGGHALYELHVDPALDYTILSGGSTMGLHESQSRLFENCVARSREFIGCLWPTLTAQFPTQLAGVTAEEFYRAVNRAEPGLIRTEADELTYSLHIMVRYELEKALLQGTLAVRDLPAAWNEKYQEYLGITVPDDTHGVLQDIHWAMGDMGYFPSYALGSAYAAQAVADIGKKLPLATLFASGELTPLVKELKTRLWQYGCKKEPAWLVENLCGGAFDPQYYIKYLTDKYTDIYGL
ncbi:MAG: carboxypeptidase M32 [Gemmiger sp.]|nr:carboxypeptidase M32 [Gemmiger sp.]